MRQVLLSMTIMVAMMAMVLLTGCDIDTRYNEDKFTLGFIPSERASELEPRAEALADFLEDEMGVEVEIAVPTSYEPLMEGLRFGHIDASYMDSGPGWLAHMNANAEVVLAEVNDGSSYYHGEIFVHKDSDLETLEDVIGTRIAFTSWTGSSGFILPIGEMINRGMITVDGSDFSDLERAIQQHFENHYVGGGYRQALRFLVEGRVDVAGGAHDAPERFLDPEEREEVRTLERLGRVPSHPIVVGEHVPEEVREKFVSAMMKLNEPENVHIIQELYGVDGLIETDTEEHLGDFGPAFEALRGIRDQVMD